MALSPLPWQLRAELFAQLATAEKAGLPAHVIYGMLQLRGPAAERVKLAQRLIQRGTAPIAAAGRSGLFSALEQRMLQTAEMGGLLEQGYARLAESCALRAKTERQLKSRLTPILFVFVAALLIQPLPRLVRGDFGVAGFLWHALGPLLVVLPLLWLGFSLPHWLRQGEDTPLRERVASLVLGLPFIGQMMIRSAQRDYVEALGLLLEAGVPMFDALPLAEETVWHPLLRADLARLLPIVEAGMPLATAVAGLRYGDVARLTGMVQTGEASGELPAMLLKIAADESEAVAHDAKQLADWLPRLAYALVAAWMAYQLLAGKR